MVKIEFNPFTGKFDLVGSGSGGTSYLDGEVEFHGDLPVALGVPSINAAFLVRKGSGIYFLNRKPAGIWVRELNNGNLDDWKYAGTFSDLYRDANFRIINDTDTSKEIAFSAASIGTGQTRVITVPNKNITLDDAGDSRTPTSHTHGNLSNDGKIGTTSGLPLKTGTNGVVEAGSFGTSAGTFCEGNDSRLSDSRTPLAHKASHAINGTDFLAPSDIGAQSLFVTTTNPISGNVTIPTTNRALIYQVVTTSAVTADINLPSSGHQSGDVIVVRSGSPFTSGTTLTIKSGTGATLDTITATNQAFRYTANSTSPNAWGKVLVDTHTHAAADITSGTLDNARVNFAAPSAIGSTTPAAGTFTTLTANNGTLTASAPVLDLAQTWNNATVTFTGLQQTITNTASAAGSRLFNMSAGASSVLSARTFTGAIITEGLAITGPDRGFLFGAPSTTTAGGAFFTLRWQSNLAGFSRDALLCWGNAVWDFNYDLAIQRDAAQTLAQRNGTNAQTFNIYNTFTSSTNHERGFLRWSSNVFQIGTEKGSGGGTDRLLNVIGSGGIRVEAASTNNIELNTNGTNRWIIGGSSGALQSVDGIPLRFGGGTSSFPRLVNSGAVLRCQLADGSSYANFEALLRAQGTAPATSGATGTAGDIRYDADYIYVCTATNTWKRVAIATW